MIWKVYLLRCSDSSLYCGVTKDVEVRVAVHNAGRGAKYTRSRRPVALVAVSPDFTKRQAFQFEYYVKQLPAHKKLEVFLGEVRGGNRALGDVCGSPVDE